MYCAIVARKKAVYPDGKAKIEVAMSGGAIVGIVVGSVAFVGGLIFLILFLLKKKKNDDKNGTEQNDEPKQAESNNDEAAK